MGSDVSMEPHREQKVLDLLRKGPWTRDVVQTALSKSNWNTSIALLSLLQQGTKIRCDVDGFEWLLVP